MDLAGLDLVPLDRIAGIIDFNTFAGFELTRGDGRLAVLRELAIELFPKIRVRDQRLRALLPDILHREAQSKLMDDHRPLELRHPQRIRARRRLMRQTLPVADLAHQTPRAAQSRGDLAHAPSIGQAALNFLVSIHRQSPSRHPALPCVLCDDGTGWRGNRSFWE